jgi:hypothetical protein
MEDSRSVEIQANEAIKELERMKADLREAKTAWKEIRLSMSIRPDLKQPAFRDPTPVDPMLRRFALILA